MLISKLSKGFTKDFGLAKRRGLNIDLINHTMNLILSGKPLPAKYHNHKLQIGKYKNCFECHITPDWLLIYKVLDDKIVYFLHTGTHSDLF
ncbi:MAG: type II toxin-antitoxin system YafQ family toxin [Elusimicrobiota bacterium]|jgi:mRNA interferase YafQ|nr:type II toxin-antitoxin system YafQ family toxin [Elusimicrobiota bacterium]